MSQEGFLRDAIRVRETKLRRGGGKTKKAAQRTKTRGGRKNLQWGATEYQCIESVRGLQGKLRIV